MLPSNHTAPEDDWYYEIGGRVHGPLKLSDLTELLDKSGETASEVKFRQGTDGQWVYRSPARTSPGTRREEPIGSFPHSGVARHSHSDSGRRAAGSWFSWIFEHRAVALLILVWILMNVGLIAWPSHVRERNCIEVVRKVIAEAEQLRATTASEAQRREFTERSQRALEPIVKELKESEPSDTTQLLLWAARDAVPRLFQSETAATLKQEQQLRQVLDDLDRVLSSD